MVEANVDVIVSTGAISQIYFLVSFIFKWVLNLKAADEYLFSHDRYNDCENRLATHRDKYLGTGTCSVPLRTWMFLYPILSQLTPQRHSLKQWIDELHLKFRVNENTSQGGDIHATSIQVNNSGLSLTRDLTITRSPTADSKFLLG